MIRDIYEIWAEATPCLMLRQVAAVATNQEPESGGGGGASQHNLLRSLMQSFYTVHKNITFLRKPSTFIHLFIDMNEGQLIVFVKLSTHPTS